MIKQELVTIYIPCRNYGKYLNQSIESVINQLYSNWELFLVDENSSDNTLDIFNSFKVKYPDKITVIKNPKPRGLQKIANSILKLSSGKYMIRLDADDWLDESALLILLSKIQSDDSLGLVFGNFYYTDSNGKIIGVERRTNLSKESILNQLPPHGAGTLFKIRSLKSVGGYFEDVNAQDGWDLWYKLYLRIGIRSVETPVFYYRQHQSSLSLDNNRLLKARDQIFEKIASNLKGDYKSSVLGVIPIKENYPNFKNVPYKVIDGKSLLELTLINASKSIENIIVSSESQKVLNFALELEKAGKVPKHYRYLRTKEKDHTFIPISDIMKSAVCFFEKKTNLNIDILIYLSLHSINRKPHHINKAVHVLHSSQSDSVVSVQEVRDPLFRLGKNGLDLINPGRFKNLSFDNERLFKFNGSLIVFWRDLINTDIIFGKKVSFIEMSSKDSLQISDIGKH